MRPRLPTRRAERGDNREVLGDRALEARRRRDDADLDDALVEHPEHAPERRVPGGVDDEPVQAHVGPEERLVRLRAHLLPPELEERALEPRKRVPVDPVRGERAGRGLQDLPELPDLEDVGHGELGDDRAPVRVAHHQPFLLELADRLADRSPAGAERRGDLELIERRSGRKVGRHDARLEVAVRLLDTVAAGQLGPAGGGRGRTTAIGGRRGSAQGRAHCVFSV
jgi:hypothetical protein